MKIRILGNSLRFRLRQPEVSSFRQTGVVTEVTQFGPEPSQKLSFILAVSSDPELSVSFEAGTTTVHVPKQLAEEWTSTDQVGFDGTVNTGQGQKIEVLVEKDFVCLDRPEEEQIGAYPNPNAIC
ncbi:DUF7009 family protein [Rufibacter tibetensis]|uniref:Uncharacterized protein n=1 Tax=Rufibacter tibetensis TaxID=512763 RepID=A0A0P0CM98_9BACT|nr:hypothetical protein [Rufibacter tibetensis]ALI98027.1 hypothetical protein DC20_02340 [Rufibacter tibetensis]